MTVKLAVPRQVCHINVLERSAKKEVIAVLVEYIQSKCVYISHGEYSFAVLFPNHVEKD